MTVSSIKVKIVRKPVVKVKVLPRFPSNVVAINPIVLTSIGGTYTFSLDATSFSQFYANADNITLGSQTGTGAMVRATGPTLVTPALGTPASGVATNLTGTAAGLTAGNVTTNANLTGPITSVGNATSIASQTGTGTKFVVDTGPTVSNPTFTGTTTAAAVNASGIVASSNTTSGTTPTSAAITGKSLGLTENLNVTGQAIFGWNANASAAGGGCIVSGAAKNTTPGSPSFFLASNDASSQFQGAFQLLGDATATNRRLLIQAIEQGVTFRNVSLAEGGGAVAIGITNGLVTSGYSLDAASGLRSSGAISSASATAGVGYVTGAGGTVTQATNRTTGVTLNKTSGAITLFSQINTAVSQATAQSFTVTNSAVAATDVIIVNQKSGTDKYEIFVTNVSAGSFQITNYAVAGTTNEAPVFNFAVIKAVTS